MTFNVSMRKLAPMDGEKPKYVAQIKNAEGKLQQEVIFQDLNADGEFTKDEICEVIEYDNDNPNLRFRYVNENPEKTKGSYNVAIQEKKVSNKWSQIGKLNVSDENSFDPMSANVDVDKNPKVITDKADGLKKYITTLRDNLMAKYFDQNNNGVLEENELVSIVEDKTINFGRQQNVPVREIIGGVNGYATEKVIVQKSDLQTRVEGPEKLKGNEKMIDILNKKLEAEEE